jgi:predicted negative regulator of RcsB-dependent stress response
VRRRRPVVMTMATLLVVAGVVAWQAWPAPSHRLSQSAAQHACAAIVARHGGELGTSTGESVADVRKLDAHFHLGVSSFLASMSKSGGIAECSFFGSALRAGCPTGDAALPQMVQVLASPDGSRYVSWCPGV